MVETRQGACFLGQDRLGRLKRRLDDGEGHHRHPIRVAEDPDTGEPAPYVLVRDNLEALIGRAVFYELVELAGERADGAELGVWSAGAFFALGPAE